MDKKPESPITPEPQPERSHERMESDRDRLRREDQEKQRERERLAYAHRQERIRIQIECRNKLASLRKLIESWVISPHAAERLVRGESLDTSEVEVIFQKIDEIEAIRDIDRILPPEYRVHREEYIHALSDRTESELLLAKIDDALGYLYESSGAGNTMYGFFLFTGLFHVLNRNLVVVQGNMIDIKRSIEEGTC